MSRLRRFLVGLAALSAALTLAFVASPTPASAQINCDPSGASWHNVSVGGTTVGRFKYCNAFDYFDSTLTTFFVVDDTTTDGYQVHLEFKRSDENDTYWSDYVGAGGGNGHSYCQSAGAEQTCGPMIAYFGPTYVPGSCGCYSEQVRLVLGRAYTPHQNAGAGSAYSYFYV